MCNCGDKRTAYSRQQQNAKEVNISKSEINVGDRNFEYTGKTALTIIGSVTGKTYRFSHPGDAQSIDLRDVAGMKMIPVLRRMQN